MFEFKFADIGEGLEEGKVASILVSEGQAINEGDSLFSVETDKVTTDIPAPVSGIITKILVSNGEDIHVGQTLAYIDTESTNNTFAPEKKILDVNNSSITPIVEAPKVVSTFTSEPAPIPTFKPTFTPVSNSSLQSTNNFSLSSTTTSEKPSQSNESASVVGEVKVSNKILPLFGSQKLI
ncbi:biotin/lipoyl-containing protein [Mycoplasmoides alvi]|uniref:biotin/lipoyl-containing protein n=1 Tax=Mycoplasmoides alvi TaxID=78580 RepID=UPI000A852D5C|nr:biotin/lipoyl-containing protein [Mycoplasmoides alvi]